MLISRQITVVFLFALLLSSTFAQSLDFLQCMSEAERVPFLANILPDPGDVFTVDPDIFTDPALPGGVQPTTTWTPFSKIDTPVISGEPNAVFRSGSPSGLEVHLITEGKNAGRVVFNGGSWGPFDLYSEGVSSAPHPVDMRTGSLSLFARSLQTNSLLTEFCILTMGCVESDWLDRGGTLIHPPAAVLFKNAVVAVFIVNPDETVSWRQAIIANGIQAYTEFVPLPGSSFVIQKVSAVSRTEGTIDLFGVGTDGRVYQRMYTDSNESWTEWIAISDTIATSAPSATASSSSRMDVFVRGQGNDLLQSTWENGTWSPFFSIGGILTSAPSAVARGENFDVFVRGADNHLYQASST